MRIIFGFNYDIVQSVSNSKVSDASKRKVVCNKLFNLSVGPNKLGFDFWDSFYFRNSTNPIHFHQALSVGKHVPQEGQGTHLVGRKIES